MNDHLENIIHIVLSKASALQKIIPSILIGFYLTCKVLPVFCILFTVDETLHHPLCPIMKSQTILSHSTYIEKNDQGQSIHAVKKESTAIVSALDEAYCISSIC